MDQMLNELLQDLPPIQYYKCLSTDSAPFGENYILPKGEVALIHVVDTDRRLVLIGDGETSIYELPQITDMNPLYSPQPITANNINTCADCEHLQIINRNKIYAVCDETAKVFGAWRKESCMTEACQYFLPTEDYE